MESESAGSLFEKLRPMIQQLIRQEIEQAIFNVNQRVSLAESKVACNEGRVVLCEQAQKNVVQSAKECVETLNDIREMVYDEVGRAQDLAKQALERAEDAGNYTIIKKEEPKKSEWTLDEWKDLPLDSPIFHTPYKANPQDVQWSMKQFLNSINQPPLSYTQNNYPTMTDSQVEQLLLNIPTGDQCAGKINSLMSAKNQKVDKLLVENNPSNINYTMTVKATSAERDVTMGFDPNAGWVLSEIQEHPTGKITKKKRSNKNANGISE